MLGKYFFTILLVFYASTLFSQSYTINGYVRDVANKELLPGVNIYTSDKKIGTNSNHYGFFSITLKRANSVDTLYFSSVGYQSEKLILLTKKDTLVNIYLSVDASSLNEIVVESSKFEKESEKIQMSSVSISTEQIKKIPALIGEKDVLKALQLMPGVKKGNEGAAGIYVRGGGADQNLLILDDAIVYNAFHLFGFLSLFNGDAIKSVELIKGGFPARYGGRLSSVVEMQTKEGNKQKFSGEGGLGLISSRLTLEGPIKKDKISFLVSARRSYVDVLLAPFMPKDERTSAYFYDANAKIHWDLNNRHKLYLSGYFGKDVFEFNSNVENSQEQAGFNWGNSTGTLRWNYRISNKLFSNTSLIFTNYIFEVSNQIQDANGDYDLKYTSEIRDLSFKYDLDYFITPFYTIKTGILATQHRFRPNAVVLRDERIDSVKIEQREIMSLESGIFLENHFQINNRFQINLGLRYASFWVETKRYDSYEPRLNISYALNTDLAFKASYSQMNQYVQLLSNSGVGLPTDLWIPATDSIPPQQARQIAIGFVRDFPRQNFFISLEGYYKKMDNIIGYKDGATFLILEVGPDAEALEQVDFEETVTTGEAWAYGIELLLQKRSGRLSGWIGYTLSWAQQRLEGVNQNRKFFARHDRRHDFSAVGIYEWKPNITLSASWIYSSGNAITLPLSIYQANEESQLTFGGNRAIFVSEFGDRNSSRAPATHRLDVSIQFHKKKKWGEQTWEISIYNAYSRANPFYFQVGGSRQNMNQNAIYQRSLFPIIPSVSYLFKF